MKTLSREIIDVLSDSGFYNGEDLNRMAQIGNKLKEALEKDSIIRDYYDVDVYFSVIAGFFVVTLTEDDNPIRSGVYLDASEIREFTEEAHRTVQLNRRLIDLYDKAIVEANDSKPLRPRSD